jgi:hypothetical protein
MSQEQFQLIEDEYNMVIKEQARWIYRIRKVMSENIVGKYLCFCFKVKDRTKIEFKHMTIQQKKHRIKMLWKKARKILFY